MKGEARTASDYEIAGTSKPIIEITLRGHLGFPNSNLELAENPRGSAKIDRRAARSHKKSFRAVEYAVAADVGEDVSRELLERRVVEDLIVRDNRYKMRVEQMAEAVVGAKRLALSDETPDKIADFIALKLQ